MREIYFTGVLSLIIIIVSGLFVGMVLGLQGYETLKRYGSADALGVLVALVAGARARAGGGGAAVREPRRLRDDRRDRPHESDRAALGDGNDGGRSDRARAGPRFWGGVISMPLLAAMFSAMGIFGGYLVGVVLIGVDDGAFWSQMQAASICARTS